jgi:hypothetical protein
MLLVLADYFGVTVDELLGRDPDPQNTQDEAIAIRDRLRKDPAYRILFDAAKSATPQHLKAAAAMLKALGPDTPDYYPDEHYENE